MIVGLSAGHADERAAEHWLREVGGPLGATHACTHLTRVPYPHVAVSLALPGDIDPALLPAVPPTLRPAADAAAAAHAARTSGRAVIFPGVERLVGVVTVGSVVDGSAIEVVRVLDGAAPGPDTELVTRDFVRPHWVDGRLTLVATTVSGGRIAPFEVPDPTPCCADH